MRNTRLSATLLLGYFACTSNTSLFGTVLCSSRAANICILQSQVHKYTHQEDKKIRVTFNTKKEHVSTIRDFVHICSSEHGNTCLLLGNFLLSQGKLAGFMYVFFRVHFLSQMVVHVEL